MRRDLGAYARFLLGLPKYLNTPITFNEAAARISDRVARRDENFLALMKRAVYGNPSSPYLPLLEAAGCAYGDVTEGIRRMGLERFLRKLKDAGVWLSLSEFKGAVPVRCGGVEVSVNYGDLANPFVSAGCGMTTGGSGGRSCRSRMDLDFLTEWAAYDHIFFKMLDLYGLPIALWYPALPASTGMPTSLRYARIGYPAERWFCILPDRDVKTALEYRLATAAIVLTSRFTRCKLARPEPVTLDRTDFVLGWVTNSLRRRGRCVLQTYVSSAVRVSLAAVERGLSLKGVQFVIGSEPLTEAKARLIESSGASFFSRYCSTELGAIAIGCGRPREPGEYHLAAGTVAVIQDSPDGAEASPLYFTSLLPVTPVVMLNVQMGDSAVVDRHSCGCMLEDLRLATHLRGVGSAERAKVEGMTVSARELVRIAEEVLPARYGGAAIDYQWAEGEDERGFTRLALRIDPGVGEIDEADVRRSIFAALAKVEGGALAAQMWERAGTIHVLRERPQQTPAGKTISWRRRQQIGSGKDLPRVQDGGQVR